ncbi:MAG: SDR family oxidoreductase [Acidobacteria bacterium]|nr:SDR family oxidoreductase [Acidobacteriota bacterium]MCH8947245.1 SDR family oxidoreductase [Acidobacteriota bacterium]
MSNRKQPTVFLTGATGAIGSRILEHYLLHGSEVLVVARERDGLSAEDRIQALLEEAELPRNLRRKVAVLEGSITEPRFGFSRAEYGRVVKAAEIFIHSAAVTNLGASAEECERANFLGTENALEFAHVCQREGQLRRFAYLSSYAASGTAHSGYFPEDSLPTKPHFANEYERTKYLAEARVREEMRGSLPVVIFRPSVTVGDTKTGRIASFNLFYQVVRILGCGMLSHWPDLRGRKVNIVPVDFVARAIYRGLEVAWALGRTFHLVSRNGCLLRDLFDLVKVFPHMRIPRLVPLAHWSLSLLSQKEQMIHRMLEPYLLPYLNDLRLETRNAERLLTLPVISPTFLRRLMEYAARAGYLPAEVFRPADALP